MKKRKNKWLAYNEHNGDVYSTWQIDINGVRVASFLPDHERKQRVWAEFIVLACNTHRDLVDALKEIASMKLQHDKALDNQMQDVAQAALSKIQKGDISV